jgi:hypothetical protein
VATKEHRKRARGLIEGLEFRIHAGPPVRESEILSAREFLRQSEFSPVSDYFDRLGRIQDRLSARAHEAILNQNVADGTRCPTLPRGKANYGGEAAGRWMQLQSAYDHVIFSTCYEGEFNSKPGRVKISHRFNLNGRIDFVELKFLRSMHPCLNGEIRKLLTVKGYQTMRKDWRLAEAFVLEVLPQELIFLYPEIFRGPKEEILAWLVNIGHRLAGDLLKDLRTRSVNGHDSRTAKNPNQLCLRAILTDDVALPILERAAELECTVDFQAPKEVLVNYNLPTGSIPPATHVQ